MALTKFCVFLDERLSFLGTPCVLSTEGTRKYKMELSAWRSFILPGEGEHIGNHMPSNDVGHEISKAR